jgi:preprotein translocase subunit SecY
MASAAEQLAANLNFGAIAKATELKQRIWFTLIALVVYRLGTYIPIPGIDTAILKDVFQQQQGGILGMFDMFAGGALGRMSMFALNIMPYISAAIIMQLLTAVSPQLEATARSSSASSSPTALPWAWSRRAAGRSSTRVCSSASPRWSR